MVKTIFKIVLLSTLLIGTVVAQPTSAAASASAFWGTWQLVSVTEQTSPAGPKTHPYGTHPSGYLTYLPDGHMSVLITHDDRLTPNNKFLTEQQAAQLYAGLLSYAGTYTIKNNTVIHHIQVAWKPSWVNTDQTRQYQFDGNHLTLTVPLATSREGKNFAVSQLVWEKIK